MLAHQQGGDVPSFRLVADKHGDVSETGSCAACLADAVQDQLLLLFRSAERQPDIALLGIICPDFLLHVGINLTDSYRLGGMAEESIVEPDDGPATAPVGAESVNLRPVELPGEAVGQKLPVRAAPAIDALLDVADHEVGTSGSIAFAKQRKEVLPLDGGSILELIQQEILEADAHFFVDERSVAAVDYVPEDGIGVVDAEDILLLQQGVELTVEIAGQLEAQALLLQQDGRAVHFEGDVKHGAEVPQGTFQHAFDQRKVFLRLGTGKP